METREPGWYPDPWGTDDERYYDGRTWTRDVRPPGGSVGVPGAAAASAVDASAVDVVAPPASASGWFADPWHEATWRWWDGSQWTGYTDRVPPGSATRPAPGDTIVQERDVARWTRVALLFTPVFQVVALVGAAIQYRWIVDHLDELGRSGASSGPAVASTLQLLGLPAAVGWILLVVWLYRASVTGRALGLHQRRSPGWAAASFLIPILQFWWPYQGACDAVGADPAARRVIVRWWAAWIGFSIGSLALLASAFLPEPVTYIVLAGVAALAVAAALTGRAAVAAVLAAHEQAVAAG